MRAPRREGVHAAPPETHRLDRVVALGRHHEGEAALRTGRRAGGHLPVDGGLLRHTEGRPLHGDLRRALRGRLGVGRHRPHLGCEVRAGGQGVLRHSFPAEREDPVLGVRRRQPAQADAEGAAQIFAHQLALHLRPQAPHLQGLPAPYGRGLRRTQGYARARGGRRHGDLQGLGRRWRQHAEDQTCG